MIADDYSYSFSFYDRSRIENLADIFSSLSVHRTEMNGRMLAHFFAHLFLLLPKPLFNIANALVFSGIIFLLFSWVRTSDKRTNILLLLLIIAMLWLFVPVFGQVFLWLDGACNYAWSIPFIFLFLTPYFSRYTKKVDIIEKPIYKILFLLLSFLAGSYSESASFAMLFIAFAFMVCIYHSEKKLPFFLLAAFAAACLGYLYLMTAPSEWSGRVGAFSLEVIAKNIKRIISAPYETMLPLFIIYASLLALSFSLKVNKEYIVSSIILFLGAWASLVLFAAALYFPWRSLLMMSVCLVLASVLMLSQISKTKIRLFIPVISAAVGIVFAFQLALGLGDIGFVYVQYRQREADIYQAISNGEDYTQLNPLDADTKYSAAYLLADIYEDAGAWPNYDLAEYYGISAISAVPGSDAVE